MKTSDGDTKGKGRIRSLSRKGTRTGKSASFEVCRPLLFNASEVALLAAVGTGV